MGLEASTVVSLDLESTPGVPILTTVPINGEVYTVELTPHYSVRSPDYQLLVQGKDGSLVEFEPGPVRTLRGTLPELPGSTVIGSVSEDGLHLLVILPGGGNRYWVEPIASRVPEGKANQYVVYHDDDILPREEICANDGAAARRFRPESRSGGPGSGGTEAGAGGASVAELGIDADFEYFQSQGSSVASVEARINFIIDTMNIQYERDVNITHSITTIIVRTAEPDPYNSTNPSTLLNQFRSEWNTNQAGIPRDVAQLFTAKNLNGGVIGIAFSLGNICTVSDAYSLVESDFANSDACATDLSAHELGHCWVADHCGCHFHTMNRTITCANQFHPTKTIPEIIAFRDSLDCLDVGFCGDGACDPSEDPCSCPQDCGDPPLTETSYSDGVDNDCDGFIDCDDSDCAGDPACPVCGDGNCNANEDPCSCPQDCGTPPGTETSCNDGVDNDLFFDSSLFLPIPDFPLSRPLPMVNNAVMLPIHPPLYLTSSKGGIFAANWPT